MFANECKDKSYQRLYQNKPISSKKTKKKNDQNQPHEQLNSTDKFSFTIRHKGRNVELLIESCRDDKKVKPCVVCSCDVYCLVSHSASSL